MKINIGDTDLNADWVKYLPGHEGEMALHEAIGREVGEKGGPTLVERVLSVAVKSISAVTTAVKQTAGVNRYRRSISGFVQNLWNENISRSEFIKSMKREIPLAFEQAWLDGAKAAGITSVGELTDEERDIIKTRVRLERSFVRGLTDYVEAHDKAKDFKLRSLDSRIELWVKRYMDLVNEARSMALGDAKLRFQYDPVKENCWSCQKLTGQVRRASFWKEHDCRPQHPDLQCMHDANGPSVCGCDFVETDEPLSRGPLPKWRAT
jgi:hypothetical protein